MNQKKPKTKSGIADLSRWNVIYKKARNPDGTLFFPEELSETFLLHAQKTMGSFIFANQYLNEIIPADKQTFKKEWYKYYPAIPKQKITFCMIDPANSEEEGSDYTGIVIVHVDSSVRWFVEVARRIRISESELVDLLFEIQKKFSPTMIGFESNAFQKVYLYIFSEEQKRRKQNLHIVPVVSTKRKEDRIKASLVPRIEWGRVFFNQGLTDLELELAQFPRGSHDDIIDALAHIETLTRPPDKEKDANDRPNPNAPDYERWFIEKLLKEASSKTKNR